MSISHEEAFRRGMISEKALHKLQGGGKSTISTKRGPGQPTKMTKFMNKSKVDEGEGHPGPKATDKNEINTHTTQKLGHVGRVSRGGAVNKGGQPDANAINQHNAKKYPHEGSSVRKQKRRHIGGGDTNGEGPYYGGPNSQRG